MFVRMFNLSICYLFMFLIQNINSASPCIYDIGNGEKLDIRPLGNSNTKTPKYDNIPNSSPVPHIFSWNACFDYSKSDGGSCTDAAACYTDRNSGQSILIAKQSEATLEHRDEVKLLYHHNDMVLTVYLMCRDADEDTVTGRQDDEKTFDIYVRSRCCCPGKCQFSGGSGSIGGGAVFLIILFVLVFVYILGGITFLKVFRGASGADMILHRLLWLNILSYAIDGLRYSIQVVRHQSIPIEYQKI